MIIYEANETDFFSNGLGTLPDATSALVTEERNGEFVLDVIYPQQGLRSELLTKNRIIKADAGHELKDQRFVIKKVTPTMDSDGYIYLTVHAEHVSYITADLGVTPNLTLTGNATQALEQWQANLVGGHPDITVDSDIISEHETSLDITKATNARQVLGGVEGSILDTWGGEYKFDNLHISLRGQRGTTANTLISYGRNLLTFEQEDDITDTYTSIYPYANIELADGNNSKLVTVDGYFVDSQYVDRYPNRKLLPVDFGSQFTDYKIGSKPSESDSGIYTTEAEIKKKLTELAKQYIENNRIGIPKVSTKITFADLSKTSEYAPLEQVNLCDIIPIRFEKLGIDTTIKVTRVVWNVLLDEYDSIELGDLRTTLGESISALESKTTGLANAVITAQSTADNQNSIFRTNGGTAEPVAKKVGDLWFKTDGDYQYMYQWDGTVWHEVVNTKTADDIAKEVDQARVKMEELVKKANNGTTIFRTEGQEPTPTAKKKGNLWFKTDNGQTVMHEWDGQKWHEIVSTKTTEDITREVDKAKADAKVLSSEVELAKKQAQEAFAKAGFNTDEINNVKTATSEVTKTLTSTVRQASELSESLKNVASETASRYSTVSSELSGARNSLTAKVSELAKEVASNSANITKANSQLYSQSEGLAKVSQSATKMEQTMTDLSGRVHTVETTAGETKEALADAKGNITTLTKRADGTDTKIADAQGRVQTLESRADTWDLELSKKVDNATYNAGIQNLGNQINLKANKSDLGGYATKAQLSVESDRITQQASAISSVTTIANGANSKIDNLSFGGRNLLDRSDGQFVMGYGITNTTWENGKAVLRYNSADVSRNSEILPQSADFGLQFPVTRGEQLTQSIYLDTDANINPNNNFEFTWFDYKDGHKFVRANIDKVGQNTYRLWGNYTWDKNDSSNLRIMDISNLYKVVDFRNSGTYLAFYHPQLEKASRPSDYSLSQNDLQRLASENTASQINQYNTGTVQPIKGIANDALGKANTANNKIDGLKIGGRNLLKGTSDQFKTITASGWMWAHTWTNNDNNTAKISLANLHAGDYLTYSAWVINDSDVDVIPEITFFDKNVSNSTGTTGNVLHPGQSGLVTNTRQIGSNDWYVRPTIISTKGQAGTHQIRIKEEMLTLGNVKLPWQPSDLDLPATIVTTVTETSNAKQIIDSWGIHTEINSVKTETTGKLNEVNNRVSDVSGRVDNVNNKIDNLKVGGRNLLDNSSFARVLDDSTGFHTKWYLVNSGYAYWNFDSDVPFSSGDDRSLMVQIKSPGSDTARGIMYQSPIVKMNTEYTISFWAKARANGMKIEVESNAKRAHFNLSTSWQRYEGVITFQSDNRTLYIHHSQGSAVGQFLIFHPQLELGNKASDWSLSQNDVQKLASKDTASQINAFNTNNITPIKQTVHQYTNKTEELAGSVTHFMGAIGYDGTNFTDKFKTVVETAGGTKETYKALEGKINGIVVGGKNLLNNTDTLAPWHPTSAGNIAIYATSGLHAKYKPYVHSSSYVQLYGSAPTPTDGLVYNYQSDNVISLTEGDEYTISAVVWYYTGGDGMRESQANFPIQFYSEYTNQVLNGSPLTLTDKITGIPTKYSYTFKCTKTGNYGAWRFGLYSAYSGLPGGSIFIADVQLEKGNKASDWGMSDNDIKQKVAEAKKAADDNATSLTEYKHTVDKTYAKSEEVFGSVTKEDFKNIIKNATFLKTADGFETTVKSRVTPMVEGGGVNLLPKTSSDYSARQYASGWSVGWLTTDNQAYHIPINGGETYTLTATIKNDASSADNVDLEWYQWDANHKNIANGNSGSQYVAPGQEKTISFTQTMAPNAVTAQPHARARSNKGAMYWWKNVKVELGEIATPWTPALEDVSTEIAKTNKTIKTVDGNVTTVRNNLDKTKSIVTQLSNLFGVNVGDSSISVTNGGVLVKGKQIHIDGQTSIDNGVIESAKIKSLDAGKITTGTLNAAKLNVINLNANSINAGTLSGAHLHITKDSYIDNASIDGAKIKSLDAGKITTGTLNAAAVKVINLDANNITTGTLSGNNLSLNLDNGTVSFKKGTLSNTQGNFKIDLNQGNISIKEPGKKNGILMTDGVFYIKDRNDSLFGEISFRPDVGAMEFSAANIGELRILRDDYFKINGVFLEAKRIGDSTTTPSLWLQCNKDENESHFELQSGTSSKLKNTTMIGKPNSFSLLSPKISIGSQNEGVTIHSSKELSLTASEEMTVSAGKELNLYGVKYLSINGGLSVSGSKNAVVQTTVGWTKINAYETAEYYFGDLGTAITDDTSTVRIGIEPLFNETVNTDIPYQVFITSYGEGYAWVAERGSNYFVIKSSVPNLEIGYEIKAKRKGYENVRLEIDEHMEVNK